jgi:hypothetical protein
VDLTPIKRPLVALVFVPRPGYEVVTCQLVHQAAAKLALACSLFDHTSILPFAGTPLAQGVNDTADYWFRAVIVALVWIVEIGLGAVLSKGIGSKDWRGGQN